MSEEIKLKVRIADGEAKAVLSNLGLKNKQLQQEIETTGQTADEAYVKGTEAEEQAEMAKKAAAEARKRANEAMQETMTMMRTSYLLFAGMGRIMGGGMTLMFRTMYSIGMSAVGTYKAISVAMAATGPAGWVQAAVMAGSLAVASAQLVGVLTGQQELTRNMRGFNMMLHGIGGMIGSFSL